MKKRMKMPALAASLVALSVAAPAMAQEAQPEREIDRIEVVGLVLHPSDQGTPRPWRQINVDASQMTITQASAVLGRYTNIRPAERAEAFEMRRRGECHVYQMPDGAQLRTTFGASGTMPASIAFGDDVPLDDERRTAYVCVVRPDGTAVVFPNCANTSDDLARIRITYRETPRLPPSVAEVTPPPPSVTVSTTLMRSRPQGNNLPTVLLTVPTVQYALGSRNVTVRADAENANGIAAGAGACATSAAAQNTGC